MKISIEKGYAIDKKTEAIVNSANNGLLLGASGAGRIRDVSGLIPNPSPEYKEFCQLADELGNLGQFFWDWTNYDAKKYKTENIPIEVGPTIVQLECLRLIKENGGKPFDLNPETIDTNEKLSYRARSGYAQLSSSGALEMPKYIIHAIGMGYVWPEFPENPVTGEREKRPTIEATLGSVSEALNQTINIVNQNGFRSLALPIMCARVEMRDGKLKVYGLTPEQSYNTILDKIQNAETSLEEVIICADNKSTSEYMQQLGKL